MMRADHSLALGLMLAGLAVAGCGSSSADGSLQRLGKVTPQGRVFEDDIGFSLMVPYRFTAAWGSVALAEWHAERAGLREAQVKAIGAAQETLSKKGAYRLCLVDGTSSDGVHPDTITVIRLPRAQLSQEQAVVADERAAAWLDAEPLSWERVAVNNRMLDRLRLKWPKFGTESACYYLDAGDSTYMIVFETTPERAGRFIAESEEIMKGFVVK